MRLGEFFYTFLRRLERVAHTEVEAETSQKMGDIVVATLGGGVGDVKRDTHIGAKEQHLEVVAKAKACTEG